MATPGELNQTLAESLGLPEATIVTHDRNLVKAGFRVTSGRGRSAARVSARDAAHLLTAILGSGQIKDSAASVERYSATAPDTTRSSAGLYSGLAIDALASLSATHSFVDAVATVIQLLADDGGFPSPPSLIEITALTPATLGTIRVAGAQNRMTAIVIYAPADGYTGITASKTARATAGHLIQYRQITRETISPVAQLLKPKG